MRTRARRTVVVLVAAVLAVAGCGDAGGDLAGDGLAGDGMSDVVAPVVEATGTPSPTPPPPHVQGFGAAPTPSASPTPGVTPSARPKPTRKPPVEAKLPPAVPAPAPSGCKPKYVGTQATRAQAKAALTEAAGRTYWPTSAPGIRVPVNLVKAVAWQESGWQSNIIACDGGIGLMQVMPDTAAYVNMRFEKNYDVDDYRDNATLGANYLAWLIKYFGDVYFGGDYTLTYDGECASHTAPCLVNAVLAAYNFGYGKVDTADGLVIPNPRYVENVRWLTTGCECLAF
ncbi:lytic transglycosylase domain-containing protein [Polymorphospora sp. NPDC050346]|uniref:lytic transglycosylase domain-containing protein n=1 Tax=Polymorphospora sp. NPDC050346 TaxID=3155780 RepID=UPI00340881E2